MKPEIRLLLGYGPLPFGASKENAISMFGDPEEIRDLREDNLSERTIVFHYWDKGFSLFFDLDKEHSFCSAEIDDKESLLFDVKVFGLKEKELVELMKKKGFELSDTEVQKWGERRLEFDKACLDCYFENNKMVSLNFGVPETSDEFTYFPN